MEAVSRENTPRYIDVEGHDPADAPQEGPSPHRGEQGLSGGGYLFNGPSETGESTMQQPSHATRVSQDGGGAKDSLYLQEDQQAENPLAPPQPLSAAVEPSPEDTRGREGASVSLGPPQGPGEHHFQENSERQGPPKTSSESAAAAARNTLKRATTTMREGVKTASAQVVHAGEKVGAVWNKTLDSAMWVCAVCGALAILLIALSLALRTWRHQHLSFRDDNGENYSRVELGLRSLQRIQTLHRKDNAGIIIIYDPPIFYQDAMDSAYCLPDETTNKQQEEKHPNDQAASTSPQADSSTDSPTHNSTPAAAGEAPSAAAAATATTTTTTTTTATTTTAAATAAGQSEEEPVLSGQVETHEQQQQEQQQQQQEQQQQDMAGVRSLGFRSAAPTTAAGSSPFLSRRLQTSTATSTVSPTAERRGPLAQPPPYSVTLGRNPGAPGSLSGRYARMREDLLGPTLFDLHCKDLATFKKSGAVLGRMVVAYIVFAGIGMFAAVASLLLNTLSTPWAQRMQDLPVNLIGTVAWLAALVLQLCGLASWGVGTDVAACVTDAGGASVCSLGSAAALAIGSLVLTLVAALSYSLFFTHKFIRDLGLEKQRQDKHNDNTNTHPVSQQQSIPPSTFPQQGPPPPLLLTHEGPHEGTQPKFPLESTSGAPQGGPLMNNGGGPHPAVPGESQTPLRSITEGSQAVKH